MKNLTTNLSGCLMVAFLSIALYAVLAFMLQSLWNWLIPMNITIWQSVLIIFIISAVGVLIVRKGVD